MTRKVVDARLDAFKPTNSATAGGSADQQIPNDDIEKVEVERRLQDLVDTGTIRIWNEGGQYTGNVETGYRLRYLVQTEDDGSLGHLWSGMVRPVTYEEAPVSDGWMELAVDDFVFGVMDTRIVVNSFDDTQIAGTSSSVLETILGDECPEIDTSLISTVTTTGSFSWNGKTVLEAVKELADHADAAVWGEGKKLGFKRVSNISSSFLLVSSDRGLMRVDENDDRLVNELRVFGGEGVSVADSQTTQSSTTSVTKTSRITAQIDTRKSEIPRVDVWTSKSGSGEGIRVRIQADDGAGNPIDASDRQSDIASRELAVEFLANGNYRTFLLPSHALPDPNPHIIVESTGSTGQDVGVDGSGNLTYKAYFGYPLDTIVEDQPSIDAYRRREAGARKTSLKKRAQVSDFGNAFIRHSSEPEREATFPARSARAHGLAPGDVITLDEATQLNASGEFIVTAVKHVYEGSDLETEVTVQEVSTL